MAPRADKDKEKTQGNVEFSYIVQFPIAKPVETKTEGRIVHSTYKPGEEFDIKGQKESFVTQLIEQNIIKKCIKIPKAGFDMVPADSEAGQKFIASQQKSDTTPEAGAGSGTGG